MTAVTIITKLLGVDEMQRGFAAVAKSLEKVGESAEKVGKKLAISLTAPMIAMGTAAAAASMVVDDALDNIRAGTGKTGDALEQLNSDFRKVFASVPVAAEEAARAITQLSIRTGLAGAPLQQLAVQVIELARMTGQALGPVLNSSTRLFGDWQIATEKQAETLDFLFKVTQQTGIGLDRLQQGLVQFGAPLRTMGFNLESAAALLGKFDKEGVNSEQVLASLKVAVANFAQAGVTDAAKAMELFIQKIKDADTASKATAIAIAAFGQRSGPEMAAAIRSGRLELDGLLASLRASPETIMKASQETFGFSEQWKLFRNQMTLAMEPLGTELLNAVSALMPRILALFDIIKDGLQWFQGLTKATQGYVIAAVALAAALGPLIKAFGLVATAAAAMSGAILPVLTATMAAISGVAVAAVTLALLSGKNMDELKGIVVDIVKEVGDAFGGLGEEIKNFFAGPKGVGPAIKAGATQVKQATHEINDAMRVSFSGDHTRMEWQNMTKGMADSTEKAVNQMIRDADKATTASQKLALDSLQITTLSEEKKLQVRLKLLNDFIDAEREGTQQRVDMEKQRQETVNALANREIDRITKRSNLTQEAARDQLMVEINKYEAMGEAGNEYAARFQQAWEDMTNTIEEADSRQIASLTDTQFKALDVAQGMHQAFQNFFFETMKGTKTFAEVVQQFFSQLVDAILQEFARVAASQVFSVVLQLMGVPTGGGGSGGLLSSLFGGGGGGGGGLLSGIGDFFGGFFAKGTDSVFSSPKLIAVGENGPERVSVSPVSGPNDRGGGAPIIIQSPFMVMDEINANRVGREIARVMRVQGARTV